MFEVKVKCKVRVRTVNFKTDFDELRARKKIKTIAKIKKFDS
jgi:hypothetical protein